MGLITISKRVGEEIDPLERNGFGLFPDVKGFVNAQFYGIWKGGYEIRLVTEPEELILVNMDSLGREILLDYFERYEEINQAKDQYERKWQIIGYDDMGLPITKYEVNRVKQQIGYLGCGCGCALLGLPVALFIDVDINWSHYESNYPYETSPYLIYGSCLLTSAAAGALVGNVLDTRRAIAVIKAARKPRVVQKQ